MNLSTIDTENESNRKKFSNWLQSGLSLEETKRSFHNHVMSLWKTSLMSWKKDERAGIPTFLKCVASDKIKNIKRKWSCVCEHQHCASILEYLLDMQQNPKSISIVWKSNLCEDIAKGGVKTQSKGDNQNDVSDNIPRVETAPRKSFFSMLMFRLFGYLTKTPSGFDKDDVDYDDIFDGCKEEHVWCIANMFMQRGKAKTNLINTRPEDTDAAMFFRMMKNCKLFDIEGGNHLFDDVLLSRDRLYHSSNNRIQQSEAWSHFNTMKALLEQFQDVQKCKDAINTIEKMRQETILSVTGPDKDIREIAKKVLKLKKGALEVDKETNREKGYSDWETDSLLEDTITDLENTEDPRKQLNEIKSREDYKRENQDYNKKLCDLQGQVTKLEAENKLLKTQWNKAPRKPGDKVKNHMRHFELTTNLLKRSSHIPEIADYIEGLNSVLDNVVGNASAANAEFREQAKAITDQDESCQDTDVKELRTNQPGRTDNYSGEPVLDHVVGNASASDAEFREQAKVIAEQDKSCHDTDVEKFINNQPGRNDNDSGEPVLDHVVGNASATDAEFREQAKVIAEQDKSCHDTDVEEFINNQPGRNDNDSGEPVLDHAVDNASAADARFRKEDTKEIATQEKSCQGTDVKVVTSIQPGRNDNDSGEPVSKEQTSRQNDVNEAGDTDLGTKFGRQFLKDDNLVNSQRTLQTSGSDICTAATGMRRRQVWSIVSEQKYHVKREGEYQFNPCRIFGCCVLPTREIVLADRISHSLKKVDARYQVIGSCKLLDRPRGICYICNNEVVVSNHGKNLQFVDVASMKLTRLTSTDIFCRRLTFHRNQLYVTDHDTIYMYSAKGIKQRVLYRCSDLSSNLRNIVISEDGSKLCIITDNKLISINSKGNHLHTFTDPELQDAYGVCVDSEGDVLVCDRTSASIMQISSDGKHKQGTIVDKSKGITSPETLCFDRRRSVLICAGYSDTITEFQLK